VPPVTPMTARPDVTESGIDAIREIFGIEPPKATPALVRLLRLHQLHCRRYRRWQRDWTLCGGRGRRQAERAMGDASGAVGEGGEAVWGLHASLITCLHRLTYTRARTYRLATIANH
jgi:hypothetical protein